MDAAREIENLIYAYAEHMDLGDLDGLADLFTHGRIHGVENGPPSTVFEGRDRVRELYEMSTRLYEGGTPMTKHVTTNTQVFTENATGRARSYYTVLQATPALPLQPIITGRYHDTFHVVDGQWWFDTRLMLVDQVGDLSHHLKYDLKT